MLPKKQSPKSDGDEFPMVSVDSGTGFAAIKLAPGIEAKSYLKDGVLFSEDANGRVIELQILDVGLTQPVHKRKSPR